MRALVAMLARRLETVRARPCARCRSWSCSGSRLPHSPLSVGHNGWIFYQGGDQLWLYTTGWLLAHGHLAQPLVGYGLPTVLAPIARDLRARTSRRRCRRS